MRNVVLYGAVGKKFGKSHRLSVETIAEAIAALRANFPDFVKVIRELNFRIVVGKNSKTPLEISEDMLVGFNLGKQDLHIIPATKGSKNGGIGKIIAGIALVGLSMVTGGAAATLMGTQLWGGASIGSVVGNIGMGLMMTGVASLIAPQTSTGETKESFTMSGPVTTMKEGGIVPIIYGRVYTGGTLINGSLAIRKDIDDFGTNTSEVFSGSGVLQ